MPYINANVTQKVTPEKAQELKSELASIIGIIPGKTEQVLMVDIEDDKTLFLRGEKLESGAYVDVRIYKTCEFSVKAEFTRATFQVFEKVLGIPKDNMYVSIAEFDTWGTKGDLK